MKYTVKFHRWNCIIDDEAGAVTGETYHAKDTIKSTFPGIKWDGSSKSWRINPEEMKSIIDANRTKLERYWDMKEMQSTPVTQSRTAVKPVANNGLCPRCKTYCYGDCSAH